MRHGQRCAGEQRRVAPAAHDAGDLEQFLGVVRTAGPAGEHQVVTGAFALRPHVPRGHPHKRIEPMQRACELRDDMRQAVAALHVRQLVQQHDAQPLERPPVGVFRHENRRRENAGRHRHRRPRAFEEAKPPSDAQPACELQCERQPRCVDNADGSSRHPLHGDEAEQQPRDDSNGANGPDRRKDGRHRRPRCGRWSRRSGLGGFVVRNRRGTRLAAVRSRLDAELVLSRQHRRGWLGGRRRFDSSCPERHDRQLPPRQRHGENRENQRAAERQRPHEVPGGRGGLS